VGELRSLFIFFAGDESHLVKAEVKHVLSRRHAGRPTMNAWSVPHFESGLHTRTRISVTRIKDRPFRIHSCLKFIRPLRSVPSSSSQQQQASSIIRPESPTQCPHRKVSLRATALSTASQSIMKKPGPARHPSSVRPFAPVDDFTNFFSTPWCILHHQ
jgi:hypothetical protein